MRMRLARYGRVSPDYYEHRPVTQMRDDFETLVELMNGEGSIRRAGEEQ